MELVEDELAFDGIANLGIKSDTFCALFIVVIIFSSIVVED